MLAPTLVRLGHRPLFVAYVTISCIAMCKSYPSAADLATALALLPMFGAELSGMRVGFLVTMILLFVAVLAPTFWYFWIETNAANANFFFGVTLAYAAAQLFLLTDAVKAVIAHDRSEKHKEASKKGD